MSFVTAPLRTSLRSLPRSVPSSHTFSAGARRQASHDAKAYGRQKLTGLPAATLGLVALFGWTAVILSVGRPVKKEFKAIKAAAPPPDTSAPLSSSSSPATPSTPADDSTAPVDSTSTESPSDGSQSAAYDPVTGEINWACPCLGGMADGPCGEEFKAAFSCFVHSEEEVKGVDCVDKFRGMQECFRKYPEIYGNDAEDDDDEDDAILIAAAEEALKEQDKFTSSG